LNAFGDVEGDGLDGSAVDIDDRVSQ